MPDEQEPTRIRPFADFLREQSKGLTHEELSANLQALVGAVADTGKKGSLTLIVHVDPIKGDDAAFSIHDEIRLKLPEHDRPASMFFADDEHNLTRRDPRQLEFDTLREVPAPTVHDVDTRTGEVRDA